MKTDTFNITIAEILQQEGKSVTFYLKQLLSAEQNYTIIKKEMLVIIHRVQI